MTARAAPKLKAPKPKAPAPARVHRVPLPRYGYWSRPPADVVPHLALARRQSGYSSVRVSKATLALLRRVEKLSYGSGLDELLYFDALQRLGECPADILTRERERLQQLRRDAQRRS
jgi:hypothetical protein